MRLIIQSLLQLCTRMYDSKSLKPQCRRAGWRLHVSVIVRGLPPASITLFTYWGSEPGKYHVEVAVFEPSLWTACLILYL